MSIEEILYQAYLIVLSWPIQEEVISDSNEPIATDIHNSTEHNLL